MSNKLSVEWLSRPAFIQHPNLLKSRNKIIFFLTYVGQIRKLLEIYPKMLYEYGFLSALTTKE